MWAESKTAEFKREYTDVVVISVGRGTARPYRETSQDCYEAARSLNQQLTFHTTTAYFAKKEVAFEESHKKTLHLIGKDGMYTNLALLLSEQCPHTIKLAVFEGNKRTTFRERREFTGSLLLQVEQAYAFIDQFNRTRAVFKGLERTDLQDYPPAAIREALLNAVVHRDYAFSGSTLMSIYDNRIEMVTLGGLVKGVSLEDIRLGVSILRNQHLANVFYRLRLIEAYGTGIPKIMESYDECPDKPQIAVTDNAFKITLPNTNYRDVATAANPAVTVSRKEALVLNLFKAQDFIVRQDVEAVAGVSQPTAVLLLRAMLEKGMLVKVGSGKYVKYKLAKH